MAGVKFIEHEGKKILSLDFAHAELEEIVAVIKEVKLLISKEPLKSVLTITNVQGIRIGFGTIRVLKDLAMSNKPFVKAGAVIGLNSLQKIELDVIMKFSGRKFPSFTSFTEAADWLINQ
jgi:hypothetical protein